jgi:hypothetical protein
MINEETFNPEQSLALINKTINTAKNKIADDGFHIIFWGWLITICALISYISAKLDFEMGFAVWAILPPLGGIFSAIYGRKQAKTVKVKTYVDSYLAYLWGAFIIAMVITLVFGYAHGIKATYFFLMLLYGLTTFITGGILNFKPLIIGSLFAFVCAILSVFLSEVDQFLCISASLIFSYIIPGHLLRAKHRSQNV